MQLKPAASELERVETALSGVRESLAAAEAELKKVIAERTVGERHVADLKVTVEVSVRFAAGV